MKKTGIAALFAIMLFMSTSVFAAGADTYKSDEQRSGMQGNSMNMVQASRIIDKNIVNDQGEDLGKIKDLILSHEGEVSYLIISRGGILGMGDNLVPIPWSAAQAKFQDEKLVLNIPKDKLDKAPSFKTDNWGEFFSPGYQDNIRAYYHEKGTSGKMEPSTGKSPGDHETTPREPDTKRSPGSPGKPETTTPRE